MKKYKIIKIEEPDFGCEGLLDGQRKVDTVVLRDDTGKDVVVQILDEELYAKNLNEGDEYWLED